MSMLRLTQISDTHLGPHHPQLDANFDHLCEHLHGQRPDIVIHTGDVAFDGTGKADGLAYARDRHKAIAAECRFIPGNHDIGDNVTRVAPAPPHHTTGSHSGLFTEVFGSDRWRFDAAGWTFIGLNSLIMNTMPDIEAEQNDWLLGELARINGKPLALFIHKPVFRNQPDEAELAATSFRYIPQPSRSALLARLAAVDLRLIACGHVHQRRDVTHGRVRHIWGPSSAFVIGDKQELIGVKEVGHVEYVFRPDSFEVHHTRAPGQTDIDIDGKLLPKAVH